MLKLAKPSPARAAGPGRRARGAATTGDEAARVTGESSERPSIALLQSHSLPALVQLELERMILAGELAPGDKLNEAALAERLGVSRGPVREAFRALEQSGLVRLEKNRGVRVRQVPVEEADDIYELRALLDRFAVERVAATAGADVVRELRSQVAHMEKAALRKDVDTFFAANLAFHDRLIELAGNAKLLTTYRRLVNELRLFRRSALAQGGALPVSAREHRGIVERIAAHDIDGAGRAIHEHVAASRERMHKVNPGAHPVAPPRRTANSRKTR
jgi:phosphonate utilization transcriptional regulator